jgi:hypothetical protein
MSLIERQFSAFFNSAVSAGSSKTSSLGNRFSVQLNTPLTIPRDSLYASLEVVSAKVWNVSPNISSDIGNNHLFFSYGGTEYDVEFPDGLYGISEMNMYLSIFFGQDSMLPKDLFDLEENSATQKASIRFNYVGVIIDFSKPDSCIDITGLYTTHEKKTDTFSSSVVISGDVVGESIIAPNEARFNRVVNYYIVSNLLSDGIPINNKSSGVVCEVPIDVRVGSLINFVPRNPLRVDCSDLIGQSKQLVSFGLVDQIGREVSTAGEEFSLAIVIRYHIRENTVHARRPGMSCPEDSGYLRTY